MLPASRIVLAGESPHAHEQEAIDFAIRELPATDPYRVWGLVELLEPTTGRLYEIDLLVLGYSALYLVEIKSGPGRYEGDQVDWYRTPPDAPARWMEPPLRLANLKAKILKSRLRSRMKSPDRAPFIQPLIFLSDPSTDLHLTGDGRIAVVTRKDLAAALTRHLFPGSPAGWRAERIDAPLAADVAQALEAIGLRKRKGKLFAGAYELGALLDDGVLQTGSEDGAPSAPSGYQDRLAIHRDTSGLTRRARVYLVPQQTTVMRRQLLRRAADREVQLLYSVREHRHVLTFVEYITDAPLGPTVLFDAFEGGVPLDAFLRRHPDLPFHERVTLLEQIARALAYCHKKDVRHGALGPHAVLVRRDPEGALETRLFNFQLGAGQHVKSTVHWSALASEPWAVYQAPELREEAGGPTPASDVFSLGALAHLVFTGRPPAASVLDLDARLAREHHLDPRTVDDTIAVDLAEAIVSATERAVPSRYDDAGEWIELVLDRLTRPEPAAPAAPEQDPLEARKDDVLGGDLTVRSILGYGATSRVLHVERASDRRAYALKVSLSPEHDERLVEEARLLRDIQHARIVRVVEQRSIADRTCLLLTLAGEQTLQRFLAREGTVSLDYAGRFGEDLLEALKELEEKQIVHRDIKPANVGVGAPGKGAVHLTLFDFSLGLAPLTELGVGTAAYRDPFLRRRGAWDPAADRWSAAVTLHEMLTGARPAFPEDPALADAPSSPPILSAERFDPAVRDRLVAFFTRALTPDAELRFASAAEMARAWTAAFDAPATSPTAAPLPAPEAPPVSGPVRPATAVSDPALLTPEQLTAIRPETPLEALPLSARARNALDRAGVLTAADLLELPDNRLSSVRGVGRLVAHEILLLRDRWKAACSPASAAPAPFFAGEYRGEDILLAATKLDRAIVLALGAAGLHGLLAVASAPASQVNAIARRTGFDPRLLTDAIERAARPSGEGARPSTLEAWLEALFPASKKRAAYLRSLYGLADPFTGRLDVTVREVSAHHRFTQPNLYIALGDARKAWAKLPAIGDLRDLAHALLDDAVGALPLERAADALLAKLPHDRGTPEPLLRARAAALFHVASEVEHGNPARLRVLRLTSGAIWALSNEAHKPLIEDLGRTADELAARAILASPGEAARLFTEIVRDTPLSSLPPERLADLAAAASRKAARSTRLEIYPRDLAPERALELSASVLPSGLPPEEIQRRVAARYPDAAPLPDRPTLDLLLSPHGLSWSPQTGNYLRPHQDAPTSLATTGPLPLSREPTAPTGASRAMDPEAILARSFEEKIAHALDRRLFRVIGVRADLARETAVHLARRAGTVPVSLDAELSAAIHRQMRDNDVDPDLVYATDREGPAGDGWPMLVQLVQLAADDVAARLLPPKKPLVLVSPGLLARYRLDGFLKKIVDASRRPESAAIFLLVPAHDTAGLPLINQVLPIRGVLPSDGLWVSPYWLTNKHNAAA